MKSLELVRRWPRPDVKAAKRLRQTRSPYAALAQRLHRRSITAAGELH